MINHILELKGVTKSIKGKMIIENLDLKVEEGKIFGFLGPNGAGKTTTLRMIVGLIRPTKGEVKICGYSIKKDFVKAMNNVGCIIENPEMYEYMSGIDNLNFLAAMRTGVSKERIKEVVELVGLSNRILDKVNTYSLGMKQRLGIAQALLNKPKLLILDEPTNGLDPAGINEFRKLISRLSVDEGITVFISSHLLSEIELICNEVAIIRKGKIVKQSSVKDLLMERYVTWEVDEPEEAINIIKSEVGTNPKITAENTISAYVDEKNLVAINNRLIHENINIKYVCKHQKSLEELFLQITEGDKID